MLSTVELVNRNVCRALSSRENKINQITYYKQSRRKALFEILKAKEIMMTKNNEINNKLLDICILPSCHSNNVLKLEVLEVYVLFISKFEKKALEQVNFFDEDTFRGIYVQVSNVYHTSNIFLP